MIAAEWVLNAATGSSMRVAAAFLAGLGHAFGHPFFRYAFLADTAIALACGLAGYFVVLRGQVFAGDALSHAAVAGALAALVAGASLLVGLYGTCILVGLTMAALGSRGRADDATVGIVFAWILGLGALFLGVYASSPRGTDAATGVNVLFATAFGLTGSRALANGTMALVAAAGVLVIARPLLFASVDGAVARVRRVPVRTLGFVFLALVGVTAAAATQAVGALVLVGLLAAPAGAAQVLTVRPFRAMAISAGIAVGSVWIGLAVAYSAPRVPPSFSIVAVATVCYLASSLLSRVTTHRSAGPGAAPDDGAGVRGRGRRQKQARNLVV